VKRGRENSVHEFLSLFSRRRKKKEERKEKWQGMERKGYEKTLDTKFAELKITGFS
jgi:hypothetical protein